MKSKSLTQNQIAVKLYNNLAKHYKLETLTETKSTTTNKFKSK
jgi:hypothetical protein